MPPSPLSKYLHGAESFLRSHQLFSFLKFPKILWNRKVYYRIHKSPSLALSWARIIQPVWPRYISLRSIFILYSHLYLCLPIGPFPSGFPTKTLYVFCLVSCVLNALPISFSSTLLFYLRRVNIVTVLNMNFSPVSYYFLTLRSKYSP
jgi:hypothetical protein